MDDVNESKSHTSNGMLVLWYIAPQIILSSQQCQDILRTDAIPVLNRVLLPLRDLQRYDT